MLDHDDKIDLHSFAEQLASDWEGLFFKPDVPDERSMKALRTERANAKRKDSRESGSRPKVQPDGLEDEGESMAFALQGTNKVYDPRRSASDPSDQGGDRVTRLLLAAMVDETKSVAREPATASSSPAKAEAGPQIKPGRR